MLETNPPRLNIFRRALALGVLSVLLISAWQSLIVYRLRGGDWSAPFYSGSFFAVPPMLQDRTFVFPDSNGYDGQFYRYIAHDPLMTAGHAAFIDDARLRYGRILLPALANFAGTHIPFPGSVTDPIDASYIALVFASIGLGVYWTARWCEKKGASVYWGLLFLATPAVSASAERMLVDSVLCALFAGFAYFLQNRNLSGLWIICALAPLTRETGFFFAPAVAAVFLFRKQWSSSLLFALSLAPAILWQIFVRSHSSPSHLTWLFGMPGPAFVERLFRFRALPGAGEAIAAMIHIADALAIAGLMTVIVIATIWVSRGPLDPLPLVIGCFIVLASITNSQDHLTEALGFGRPISPLLLWVMVEAVSRRKWPILAAPLFVQMAALLPGPAADLLRAIIL